jgi:hypothetical protein
MNKCFIITLLLASFSMTAMAQLDTQKTFRPIDFGIRTGGNAFIWGGATDPDHNFNYREGMHAGIYGNMFISDRFSVEPGLYYSLKGTRFGLRPTSRAVLHYIDLPVVVRYFVTDGFNVFAGPQVSFLVGSTMGGDFFDTTGRNPDDINTIDAGAVFGLMYKFHGGINVQLSYDLGLVNLFNDNLEGLYNRGFKLSLGYNFYYDYPQ